MPEAILSRGNLAMAGFLSGAASVVPRAMADTELEIADLPPTWVPVVFGLGLLVVSIRRRQYRAYLLLLFPDLF